jgi:predicted dithiol-disulfide oxidoreductase (DUF899 family)
MSLPQIVSEEQWVQNRKELLAKEKQLTKMHEALNAERRRLPMVRVDKNYVFEGPNGQLSLLELFDGSRQLIVKHFMFDPTWDAGCPGCSADADEFSEGLVVHLKSRDTAYAEVSRAPLTKIKDYRSRKGWTIPWYSSYGSDFNYDFHASFDESISPILYNYRTRAELEQLGETWDADDNTENPGYSCFLRDGDTIYHTYSTFARGTEYLSGTYSLLDLTALGRQENWELPRDRVADPHGADPTFSD